MKKWLQKSIMITVALLTFGLITPTHEIWDQLEQSKSKDSAVAPTPIETTISYSEIETLEPENPTDIRTSLMIAAKEQSYIKFGTRIAPKIEQDFNGQILPKMQEAIDMTLARLDQQTVQRLAISEKPSGDYAEKIFHISDEVTGEDIIRFHVRTENRPFEGYFYNFHYHMKEDEFATHYDLGEIYWAKDTPPKWLS